jgi:hypothetical protein
VRRVASAASLCNLAVALFSRAVLRIASISALARRWRCNTSLVPLGAKYEAAGENDADADDAADNADANSTPLFSCVCLSPSSVLPWLGCVDDADKVVGARDDVGDDDDADDGDRAVDVVVFMDDDKAARVEEDDENNEEDDDKAARVEEDDKAARVEEDDDNDEEDDDKAASVEEDENNDEEDDDKAARVEEDDDKVESVA